MMLVERAFLVLSLVAAAPAAAQTPRDAAAPKPVISCVSLSNLRLVLRTAGDDPSAAVRIIKDPKSDFGCSVIDRNAVKDVTDRVTLGGATYDCVALQGSDICQWTLAGTATAPLPAARQEPLPSTAPEKPKGRP